MGLRSEPFRAFRGTIHWLSHAGGLLWHCYQKDVKASSNLSGPLPLFHLHINLKYMIFPLLANDAVVFPGRPRLFLFLDEIFNSNCLWQVRLGLLDFGTFCNKVLALNLRLTQKLNLNLKPGEILWGQYWLLEEIWHKCSKRRRI